MRKLSGNLPGKSPAKCDPYICVVESLVLAQASMKSASSPGATSPHDHTGSTESQGPVICLILQTWLQLCLQISLWHQKFLDIMEQCIPKVQKMDMSSPWFSKRIGSAIRKHIKRRAKLTGSPEGDEHGHTRHTELATMT